MTNDPEQHGEHPLDEVTAERLLRGVRPSAGATAGEQALGELLAAVSAPPSARELSGETRAVAAFSASRSATTGPRHSRHVIRRLRPAMRPRVSHGVAAAAAFGALAIGGVAAAAYTGSLPTSIQRLAHDHLGAPHPRQPRTAAGTDASSQQRGSSPTGPFTTPTGHPAPPGLSVVTSHPTASGRGRPTTTTPTSLSPLAERYGLCTAYSHARAQADEQAADNALRRLEKAAGRPDHVSAYCAPVWHTSTPSPNPEPHDSANPTTQHPPLTAVPPVPDGRPPG
jgi:hypothetical protein